jgi:mRNA-degrading endonuclease RelE of RelBE toxin-antitoxin system
MVYGYNIARMPFEIILSPEAVRDFRGLRAPERRAIREALELHLRHEPTKTSRSRIKRLRGVLRPQFRLRVEDFRIFYDVVEGEVQVIAIVAKADANGWLRKVG